MRIGYCCEEYVGLTQNFIASIVIYRTADVPREYVFTGQLHERFRNTYPVLLMLMLVKFVSDSVGLQKCVVFDVCQSVHER